MFDFNNDLDDIQYEHHLKHRSSANQKIFVLVWASISAMVLLNIGRRVCTLMGRRILRSHHFGTSASIIPSMRNRVVAHFDVVAVSPFPQLLRQTLTELATGQIAVLATYLVILVVLLLSVNAPVHTPYFVDDVAFRAAWVSVTQIPLVFFLSTKNGLINVLVRVSYERVLYLHKWVGRMIFASTTIHFAIMKSSISIADIMLSRDRGAAVVRYGIGSYFLLAWIALSSIFPVRSWSYRAFYINHWISTLAFLMLVIQHVPKYALTPIYVAFGFVAIDKISTLVSFARINISVRSLDPHLSKFRRGPGRAMLIAGYQVEMLEPHTLSVLTETEESTTAVRIRNVPLKWRPGQHIRLYLPALGAFELHPFTPANCSSIAVPPPLPPRRSEDVERRGSGTHMDCSRQATDILLMIGAHAGLTRRLKNFHTAWLKLPCPNASMTNATTPLTAYVDGPYGSPPCWERYEKLVLIVTSTGISFALSIVDYLEQLCLSNEPEMRTRTIHIVWIVRHIEPQFEATVAQLLRRHGTILKESGVRIEAELHVTCVKAEPKFSVSEIDHFAHLRPLLSRHGSGDRALTIRNPDDIYDEWEEEERQWAEMEALEEMQIKQVETFDHANEVNSVCSDDDAPAEGYEGKDYASSEISTMLNRTDDHGDRRCSSTFSNVCLTMDEDTALDQSRATSSPVRTPLLPRRNVRKERSCECALIQYQREKLDKIGRPLFDSCSYGRRPDIVCVITSALRSNQHSMPMVAVCANRAVSNDARIAVSQAKFAFARAQRTTDVEIFVEGFN